MRWRDIFRKGNFKRFRSNMYYLLNYDIRDNLQEQEFRIKDGAVEDCIYEFDSAKEVLRNLQIISAEDTLKLLQEKPKSFSRFGDGEVHIMQGKDSPFQRYNPELAQKLLSLLEKKRNDIYIGLNRSYFQSPFEFSERNHRFYRLYGTELRRFFIQHCDPDSIYLDACCFGGYYRVSDDYDYEQQALNNRNLFAGKKIAIVSGEGVLEKLTYNVFDLASDCIILHGPATNAYDKYYDILDNIQKVVPHDYIVCLIMGMTATAMVADLSNLGYIAWDVGHIAKDYDAYMNHYERNEANREKFWQPD